MAYSMPVESSSFIFGDRTYYLDDTTFATDKTQRDYECPVCYSFMQQPVKTCEGASWVHRFCLKCTDNLIRCPIDNRQITHRDIKPDPNWITGVRAHCPNKGCPQTFPISPTMTEAKEHLVQHCPKQQIECPGHCGETLTRETLTEHKKTCKQYFRCTCEQFFSQQEPIQEFMRHVHENPERHEFFGLMRYMVNNMGDNTSASQQPLTRLAGIQCKPHSNSVYQSIANPQTFFFTIHHASVSNYERLIRHPNGSGHTYHELKIFVQIAPRTRFHLLKLEFTDSLTSHLTCVRLTPYSGRSEKERGSIDLPFNHQHYAGPICFNDSQVKINGRKEYLFKIELQQRSPPEGQ